MKIKKNVVRLIVMLTFCLSLLAAQNVTETSAKTYKPVEIDKLCVKHRFYANRNGGQYKATYYYQVDGNIWKYTNNLAKKGAIPTRLKKDVKDFVINNGIIVYITNDSKLHVLNLKNNSEKVIIAGADKILGFDGKVIAYNTTSGSRKYITKGGMKPADSACFEVKDYNRKIIEMGSSFMLGDTEYVIDCTQEEMVPDEDTVDEDDDAYEAETEGTEADEAENASAADDENPDAEDLDGGNDDMAASDENPDTDAASGEDSDSDDSDEWDDDEWDDDEWDEEWFERDNILLTLYRIENEKKIPVVTRDMTEKLKYTECALLYVCDNYFVIRDMDDSSDTYYAYDSDFRETRIGSFSAEIYSSIEILNNKAFIYDKDGSREGLGSIKKLKTTTEKKLNKINKKGWSAGKKAYYSDWENFVDWNYRYRVIDLTNGEPVPTQS